MLEAKAAINTNLLETIGILLFFAINRYKLRISFDLQPVPELLPPKDVQEAKERARAVKVAKDIKLQSKYLQEQILLA